MVSVMTRLPEPLGFHIAWLMKKKLLSFIWKVTTLSIYSARDEISLSDVANLDLVLAVGGGWGVEVEGGNGRFTVCYTHHMKFSCLSWNELFYLFLELCKVFLMIDKKWIVAEATAAGADERGFAWASGWTLHRCISHQWSAWIKEPISKRGTMRCSSLNAGQLPREP